MEGATAGTRSRRRGSDLPARARARGQPALRFGVIVGAPLAAGVAAGGRAQGAIAAAAALMVVLHGPPGYGIARRADVVSTSLLVGVAGGVGALVQGTLWLTAALLVLFCASLAAGRALDRGAATLLLGLPLALLVGIGAAQGLVPALELVAFALVGGLFVLVLDRAWPSPEHPAAALESGAGRLGPAIAIVPALAYLAVAVGLDGLPANAAAFAALALLLMAGSGDRRGELWFLVVALAQFGLVAIDARGDVLAFGAFAVACAGAWRASVGVLPRWSALGTAALLVIIAGT
ncbi:MAG: hypothetical protein ACO3KD_03970 [Gaiellales bacterium]